MTAGNRRFTAFCSSDAANGPKEDDKPIELSRHSLPLLLFRNEINKSYTFLSCLSTFFSGSSASEYPAFPTVLDINQIRDILPHR